MKKLFFLLATCAASAGYAQDLIPLTAALNGANAVPPNASPLVASASLTFGTRYVGGQPQFPGTPPTGVLTDNTLLVLVFFTPANLMNALSISPAAATIQDEAGNVIMSLNAVVPSPTVPFGRDIPFVKYAGFFILTSDQASHLFAGRWYVHISATGPSGEDYPNGQIRGQILPADADDDGIPDYLDQCPNTGPGSVVDAHGCSIEQLCPCDGTWKNHGDYLRCVNAVTRDFSDAGLITETERQALLREAQRSHCGGH
jgi:hypothetical protein